MELRIGQGYDSHRFEEGRLLVLCGEVIPSEKGLAGHSDADAPVHALIDALLGALALGDIGHFFPDTDLQWKNADSMELLKKVLAHEEFCSWKVNNVDFTIITQKPKLSPYISGMRRNLAVALQTDLSRVSIKAKTNEKMGFTGRGEGLEAQAVVLLIRE